MRSSPIGFNCFELENKKRLSAAVGISEVVRMARMHPSGPKRTKIVLGGWSDFARLCTPANGKKAAALMAKLVALTFADGVDLDFEHLSDFDRFAGCDEFAAFASLIAHLRVELDKVAASCAPTSCTCKPAAVARVRGQS